MTATVGQVLQRARTQRGIDLNQVERGTKIRLRFLRAMEEDRWEELPGPEQAQGLLETYARYLDLDPEHLSEQYEGAAAKAGGVRPIPADAIRPGGTLPNGRGPRPYLLVGAGLVVVVLLGLVIAGALGGSGGGGTTARHSGKSDSAERTATTAGPTSRVSLDLRSTDAVWVCLVDSDNRELVAETLPAGQTRGPFDGRAFDVTFGNGSVQMTVDGEAAKVPPLAEPLGYRITPSGVHRLDPASQPTCT